MPYSNINLENLAELKNRRGNSNTPGLIATILGLNYPVAEAWSVYLWVDTSTATPDDTEVVASNLGDPAIGRWIRIDLSQTPQVNADWNSASGPSAVLNKPTLGTAAPLNVATTGNAAAGQVVLGSDTRLSDARAPTPHSHAISDVTGLQTALNAKQATVSLTTTGTGAATFNSSTGALNVPTPAGAAARVFGNPARALNTAFQISATRDVLAIYSVDIGVTSLLLAGASGRVFLEYADDAAFTTNVVTASQSPNATGGVLNVTNLGPGNVAAIIPAAKYARIRTATVSGSPTFSFAGSQEVQL